MKTKISSLLVLLILISSFKLNSIERKKIQFKQKNEVNYNDAFYNNADLSIPWWLLLIKVNVDVGLNKVIDGQRYECIDWGVCHVTIGRKPTPVKEPNHDDSYIGYDKEGKKILILGKEFMEEFTKKKIDKKSGFGFDPKTMTFIIPQTVKIDLFQKISSKEIPKEWKKPAYLYANKKYKITKIDGFNVVYLD